MVHHLDWFCANHGVFAVNNLTIVHVLIISGDCWDGDVDERALSDLPPPLCDWLKQGHNHSTSPQLQNNSYLIRSLLHERGAKRHAMFQPDVNHRATEEVYFNEHTADDAGKHQIPMMQSFVSWEEKNMFNFRNPISCVFFLGFESSGFVGAFSFP